MVYGSALWFGPMAAAGRGAPVGSSEDFERVERIGRYQIITPLSVGGMAELFLGFTSGPGGFRKYVAIKRILPGVRGNEQFVRMFLDEARITAAFNHPNITQVYELGQEQEGLFLAMEFIAGQDLDHVCSAFRRRHEAVPLGLSLSVMRDVCLALNYAHAFTDASGRTSPIIHRDVAQKNIMVTYEGGVKLLDFGIAKARNSLERTHAGTVKGTSGYMSPEQVRGEPIDGRSDLFSAGVVLWELVTGRRLFAGKTERDEMINILEAPIEPPSHPVEPVPEELSAVILKALDRDAEKRFPNGKEMARALVHAAGVGMFDADRRATLMQELFVQKMAAMRALMERTDPSEGWEEWAKSWREEEAGRSEPTTVHDRKTLGERKAGGERRKVGGEKRTAAERARAQRPTVPGGSNTTQVAVPRVETAGEEGETNIQLSASLAEEARTLGGVGTTQVAGPEEEEGERGGRWSTVLWAVVLVGVVVGGGFGVLHMVGALNPVVPPEPNLPVYAGDTPLKIFPEPGQPPPVEAASDGGTAPGVAAEAPAAQGAEAAEEDKPDKPARVARGKLTLIILPEAEVFRGKRSLGKTPLFNTPLPAGTHLLRIIGPDGKRRVLSVPIKAGETARLRFSLGDIPEKR